MPMPLRMSLCSVYRFWKLHIPPVSAKNRYSVIYQKYPSDRDKKNRTYRELKKIAKYHHMILSLSRVRLKMSRPPKSPKASSTGIKANPLRLRDGCSGQRVQLEE
ncbi:hypothetical protein TNCV_3158651 [Trichonephila clavipes]|nr:hypothetical protein TNCV_3158651 [Trichonephila clavipes]